MLFSVGDIVVHPAYGGGRIKAIRERSFLDHTNQYYEIHMPAKNMTIMVPLGREDEVGLRPVSNATIIEAMWAILGGEPDSLSDQYQERQDGIKGTIRGGDLIEIATAMRDLAGRGETHKLTQADRGLLEQAEAFIAGELALAKGLALDEAKKRLRAALSSED